MSGRRAAVWRRAGVLFERALEEPTGDRRAFLTGAYGNDRELRSAVESLLDHDAPDGRTQPTMAVEEEPPVGQLGPYRLLHPIGRGGMGRVWLGERSDGEVRQRVAVKQIERPDHPVLARLFRRERQILARLEHPNIARFLDSGVAEGFPYVVMEYVPGVPLTEYCDARRLGVRPRLELFLKVCRAVQHAHQSLIVHRDLKPRNILVTDEGEPKLLDFGIAKLLDLTAGEEGGTVTLGRFLTPDYASPEQLAGQPVSTASDLYSLGVILYELLTGCMPFERAASPAALLNLRRHDPAVPSERAKRADREIPPEARAACRGLTPARLRRHLKGDLDRIVLLVLHLDPGERYGSVEQLAIDLRRYLSGLAVLAQPPRLAYRARKFMRRHLAAIVAASVLLAALVAFAAQSALHSQQLAWERDLAVRAQEESEQVTRLLIDAFRLADPYQRSDPGAGPQLTAREVLDRSAERVTGEFAGQPLVQARLMDALGEVYANLGAQDRAFALLRQGYAIRRRTLGLSHPEVVKSLRTLGLLLIDRGQLDEAQTLLGLALAYAHSEVQQADGLAAWGWLLLHKGDYAGSARELSAALELQRRAVPGHSRNEAEILIHRGVAKWHLGEGERAEPDLQRGLALLRRVAGEDHPSVARAFHYLGLLRIQQGDLAAAEPLFRRAVALRRTLQGTEHPKTIESLAALGRLLVQKDDHEEAKKIFHEALALDRKVLGSCHPNWATDLTSLGVVLSQEGDLARAELVYREAADIARERWGPERPRTRNLRNLGKLLSEKGELAKAEPILRNVLDLQLQRCDAAWALEALAELLVRTGRPTEALPLAELVADEIAASLGEEHWRTAMARSVQGDCLTGLGHYSEAERLLLESLSVIVSWDGESSKHTRAARERLARLYRAWGRPAGTAPSSLTRPPATASGG